MTGVRPPEGYLGTAARITSGPAPELVEAGYALEIADAPLLHRGLTLADLAHLAELVECGALTRDEAAPVGAVLLKLLDCTGRRVPLRRGLRRRLQQPGTRTGAGTRPGRRAPAPRPDPPGGGPHRVPARAARPAAQPAHRRGRVRPRGRGPGDLPGQHPMGGHHLPPASAAIHVRALPGRLRGAGRAAPGPDRGRLRPG